MGLPSAVEGSAVPVPINESTVKVPVLFRSLGGLPSFGLTIQRVDDLARLGIAQNNPRLVLDSIGIRLQVLHMFLQPAILLLQFQNLLLQHFVLIALLQISG